VEPRLNNLLCGVVAIEPKSNSMFNSHKQTGTDLEFDGGGPLIRQGGYVFVVVCLSAS